MHFVVAGKGKLFIEDKEYHAQQGDIFLLPVNKSNNYRPDSADPWHYFWIEFFGEKALQICDFLYNNWESPVYKVKNFKKMFEIFSKLYFCSKENSNNLDLLANSVFCEMLMHLKNEMNINKNSLHDEKNCYIHFIVDYIHHNIQYSNLLKLSEISNQVYLTPNYISHLFKKYMGISIQSYINNSRMIEACKYLIETNLPIKQIAELCGYPNQLYFSRIFKKTWRHSPSEYRRITRNDKQKSEMEI